MPYANKTIVMGSEGTFQAAEAIALYARVKFNTSADSAGKPKLVYADAADVAIGVAMEPIADGAFGLIRFLNSPGEQFGLASGTIGLGVTIYGAADGKVSTASGGGAKLVGISTTTGADGGTLTYMQSVASA
jgi:hypothetical protein